MLCPPPGALPNPRTEPASLTSPALAGGSLPLVPLGKPRVPPAPCPTRVHRGPALPGPLGSRADDGPAFWAASSAYTVASLTTCGEESLENCLWVSHVSDRMQYTSSFLLASHWPGLVTRPHPSAREPGKVSKKIHSLECVSVSSTRSSATSCHLLVLKKSSWVHLKDASHALGEKKKLKDPGKSLHCIAEVHNVKLIWYSILFSKELMLLICDSGEDPWESLEQQGDQTSPSILMEINSEYSSEGLKL